MIYLVAFINGVAQKNDTLECDMLFTSIDIVCVQ